MISHLIDFWAVPPPDEGVPPVLRLAQAFSFGGGAGITFSGRAPWLADVGGRDPGEVGSSTSFSECSFSWCLEPTHTHTHDLISDVQKHIPKISQQAAICGSKHIFHKQYPQWAAHSKLLNTLERPEINILFKWCESQLTLPTQNAYWYPIGWWQPFFFFLNNANFIRNPKNRWLPQRCKNPYSKTPGTLCKM